MQRAILTLCTISVALVGCGDNASYYGEYGRYEGLEPETLPCVPNLDGTIESYELAPTLDQIATYLVSPALPVESTAGRPVDIVGTVADDGHRVWDWSDVHNDDQVADMIARPLGGQWFVEAFPDGEFVFATDAASRIEAIYSHGDDALVLHGFASARENPPGGQTLMVYEEPVVFFPFPLSVGETWTQTGVIRDGTLNGLHPWSQDDVYEVTVDAIGELRLPDFTFRQALRVHTHVTILPKVGLRDGFSQHQHSFIAECFGEVARASSPFIFDPDDDLGADFSIAHEVRRLGWP